MSKLQRIVALVALALVAPMASGAALAQEPRAETDCPASPGDEKVWPYELPKPLFLGEAPKPPERITDVPGKHYDGPPPIAGLKHHGSAYCLYRPPSGTRAKGLILLLHGWQAGIEIGAYDQFARFLAKSGYFVVYPYVSNVYWDTGAYPARARAALVHALGVIREEDNIFVWKIAVVGHSLGGFASVRLAAQWPRLVPKPRALVVIDAGVPTDEQRFFLTWLGKTQLAFTLAGGGFLGGDTWEFDPDKLAAIPCETRLLMIEAQSSADGTDPTVQKGNAPVLWKNLAHIAKYTGKSGKVPRRNFLRIPHDESHGPQYKIRSTHLAPNTTIRVICNWVNRKDDNEGCSLSSMDEWGYWRPTLGAVHEAFTGKPLEPDYSPYCSSTDTAGTCARTRFMGVWKDRVPATPMKTAAEIPELATDFPDYCPQ